MKSSTSTGRLHQPVTATARRILFEQNVNEQIDAELGVMCHIDKAHILMLQKAGLIGQPCAKQMLLTICSLEKSKFAPLRDRSFERGLYLSYESYLIERLGLDVGGMLQTGRSRNDLKATVQKIRMRKMFSTLLRSAIRLQCVVIRRATQNSQVVMPAYTHCQVAEPSSLGHYLAGVAASLDRNIAFLIAACDDVHCSPLGASAIAGNLLPIDCMMTARLLGFRTTHRNSIDAVASRDLTWRILAAAAILCTDLSRVATDLLQWSTAEFGLIEFPDDLVGSSSAMPQKRNPFLLEHVQGRSASPLAVLVHTLAASRNVGFTNSISVGTESMRLVETGMRDAENTCTLLRLAITGLIINSERMKGRVVEGFANASALAIWLMRNKQMDFRSAHRRVGEMINEAVNAGFKSLQELCHNRYPEVPLEDLDPENIQDRMRFGGGPSSKVTLETIVHLKARLKAHRRELCVVTRQWSLADVELSRSVLEAIA
jgi:argininosuccinate lyase